MAALLCVREDRQRADQLAAILKARGFELDSSASAFERPTDYEASVALFSPAAVKSSLLLWAAKQAQDARRLVPIFVSLTALPRAFSLTAIHDLTEWSGEEEHQGVAAVQRHLLRLQRARSDQEALANLGRGKAAEPLPEATAAQRPRQVPERTPEPLPDRRFDRPPERVVEPVSQRAAPEPAAPPASARPPAPAAETSQPRRFERFAQRPMMATPAPRPGSMFGSMRGAGAAPALRIEPEQEPLDANGAPIQAPSVSAAARRRRLILRERMLSGLPLD